MLRVCSILVVVANITLALSDHSHIHGIVRDSVTKVPIPNATVMILKTGIIRRTASDGRFDISGLHPGIYRLGIRCLGYYDRIVELYIHSDTTIEISLRPIGYTTHAVVVETHRISGSPTEHSLVLDDRTLDQHRGLTFGELIEELPGVTLLRTGPTIAKPVVRGLHSQRIVIATDGIQHQAQEWGLDHAPAIDPFLPSSIAVVRGAASIEDSYAAIGGVIRIESLPLRYHTPFQGHFSALGASNNGMGGATCRLSGSDLLLPNTAYSAQLSGMIAGDSRTPSYVLSNTGARQLSGMLAVGYDAAPWRHELRISGFATELGILAASHLGNYDDLLRAIATGSPLIIRPWTYRISNPRQEILHTALHYQSTYSADIGTFELRYGWQLNDRKEYDAHNARYADSALLLQALSRPAIELALASYQLEARYRRSSGESSQVFGLHLLRQANARSGRVFLVPDYTLYEGGIIATHTLALDNWIASAGIRADFQWLTVRPYNKATGRRLPDTAMVFFGPAIHVGIEGTLSNSTRLQLNLATHWRPPTPVELFADDLHHGTAQYEIGDRRLRSERVFAFDGHLRTQLGSVTVDLSTSAMYFPAFTLLLPDPQPTVTYRGVFPTMRYRQRSAAMVGAEVMIAIPMGSIVRWDFQLSMVRGYDALQGTPLPFLPADRGQVNLHWHLDRVLPLAGLYADFTLQAVRRQTFVPSGLFDYASPPAGYILINIRTGTALSLAPTPIHVELEIQNVLNTSYRDYLSRYRYFALEQGRNIILRFSVPFDLFHQQEYPS
ncbi:MAG: TonB-dependent receptor [Bacteroidota bacterium]|nr:TonB-dependent receptor [Candidatus Kapabacteria bacterium]MCS7302201.1 TonB-dependent receptor [Candidatus Kapabacteria bacterium]MDW8074821.1 TonB-dependent receptor [Bacteroidota bacterium]MDW8271460.1 TonB-dependent receptor [Bacteroidota bacterium]